MLQKRVGIIGGAAVILFPFILIAIIWLYEYQWVWSMLWTDLVVISVCLLLDEDIRDAINRKIKK